MNDTIEYSEMGFYESVGLHV